MVDVRRLSDLSPAEWSAVVDRDAGVGDVREEAAAIVERVRAEGDAALRDLSSTLDGVSLDAVEVTDRAAAAVDRVDDDLLAAIRRAAANVRDFHERQVREDWRVEVDGRELGRRFRPIERVGAYVPGGTPRAPS